MCGIYFSVNGQAETRIPPAALSLLTSRGPSSTSSLDVCVSGLGKLKGASTTLAIRTGSEYEPKRGGWIGYNGELYGPGEVEGNDKDWLLGRIEQLGFGEFELPL